MKGKTTYNLFDCFSALKGVITFCLLLSMMAQPIASVIFNLAGIEYELNESFEEKELEEKELEEKENTSDSEEEDQNKNHGIPEFQFQSNYKPSLFALHKDLISSHLDIPFPPPDRC